MKLVPRTRCGVASGARNDYEGVGRWFSRQFIEDPQVWFIQAPKAPDGTIGKSFAML